MVGYAVGVVEGCGGEVVACGGGRRERMARSSFDGCGVCFEKAKTGGEAGLRGVWAGVVREDGHCCLGER